MKTVKHMLATTAFGALLVSTHAATVRVPQDQPSIQAAVTAANADDTILISDGTYNEHGIILTQALTVRSVNGNATTTVDGQNLGGIFQINLSNTNKVTIQGLTIRGGTSSGSWTTIRRVSGMLGVRDCLFEQNYGNGGVIDARGGAGFSVYEPDKIQVMDCVFRNNSAENISGVIGVTAIRCLFYGNTGWNNAIAIAWSNATNCTVYGNTGGFYGGGVSDVNAANCIIWGNGEPQRPVSVGTITYSIVQGGFAGTGNLSSDPLFVNAGSGDFHLQSGSPAVNTGDPSIFDSDGTRSDMGTYGGNFTVQPCSPHKATATATLVNGFVVGTTITDPGCGYTNAPTVLIQDGGGSGATATAVVSGGQVIAINITSAGCCYTNAPTIVIGSPPFVPSVSIAVSKVKVTQNVVLGRNTTESFR